VSAAPLQTILAGSKRELVSAEKKARFFRIQYRKYKVNSPDTAASLKVLRESAIKEVALIRKQIKSLTALQKRYAELEAKRTKPE
jgi:hypothetical protein